ncbi:MAG: hypothetical protein PHP95_14840 [Desulfuromonadaceae bacterium]|nr:hypothetical protein [Desulfuromonadaceae bacterium]MDD2849727.1 hypothetical protein [Desulfuromonadaceae bacterium]MDD4130773.1 hypothetical protein [Desulfuromonadaceae bacterium]
MKCPKCGYNSFEYYDRCKKCSDDLIGYKQTFNITSLILPVEAREKLAAEYRANVSVIDETVNAAQTNDDIFSFDLPEDPSSLSDQHNDDPFNFDEPASDTKQSADLMAEDDAFADLLESTSQNEVSTFATPPVAGDSTRAKKVENPVAGPGEFDLESFSWDEAPAAATSTDSKETDDFDSLFGDTKSNNQK